MLVWAAVVTERAVATVPTTFEPGMFERAEAFEAVSKPWTVRADRTPTEVIFGWAFPVTTRAAPTTPVTFAPVRFERPEAFPEYRPATTVFKFETP